MVAKPHSTENYDWPPLSLEHASLLFDFPFVGQSIGGSLKDSRVRQGNTKQLI